MIFKVYLIHLGGSVSARGVLAVVRDFDFQFSNRVAALPLLTKRLR